MNQFHYATVAQEIIFGVGALDRLGEAVTPYGWERLMLCASPSLRKSGVVDRIAALLGRRLVVTFAEVSPHVQASQLEAAVNTADAHQIDAVIGLGGGSPLGMAKAVSLTLEARRAGVNLARANYPTEQPLIPGIAIPTTYAGSEMTPTYGITRAMDDGSTHKITIRDNKVTPKLVIYDPALTLDLPPVVTASTGINALAHCIEAIYSIRRNPLSTAAARSGIGYMIGALPRCFQDGADLLARTDMLVGANLGGQCLATVTMGVHHGTCHVLGGTAGVPHGVANSIILPHAIRFNLDTVAPLLAQVGEAMGISHAGKTDVEVGEAVAGRVYDLVGQMALPQRLRDVDVPESLLPRLAEHMLISTAVKDNPKPVTTTDEAMSLLRAAW